MQQYIIFLILSLLVSGGLQAQFADRSQLADGSLYRLAILKDGVYKVDASLLEALGANPQAVDPGQVQVLSAGGGMLPQPNAQPRPNDLGSLPVLVQGSGDGRFDAVDYVLFYAAGPDAQHWDGSFIHFEQNLYADTNYVFLKLSEGVAPPLPTKQLPGAGQPLPFSRGVYHHEQDEVNYLDVYPGTAGTGRLWLGENFILEKERAFTIPIGQGVGQPAEVEAQVMANSTTASTFFFQVGGQVLDTVAIRATPRTEYGIKGRLSKTTFDIPHELLQGGSVELTIRYATGDANAQSYLDFFTLNMPEQPTYLNAPILFNNAEAVGSGTTSFQLQSATADLHIWEVTDALNPVNIPFTWQNGQASFADSSNTFRRYCAFVPADVPAPIAAGSVPNQNLHGLATPNLLIVAPGHLLPEAQRLAAFREQHDGLTVAVVTDRQVYNEFSGGRQDVTAIRDLARMLYLRNSDPVTGLRYLLLFGDASYDFKGRVQRNTNQLPIYQARESLHPIYSYSSDDYFGLLENHEGDWQESPAQDEDMEIGIGRLPVNTLAEARTLVDKLIHYASSPNTLGKWRNKLVFVADDGDINIHQMQADRLADFVEANYGAFNNQKLFVDAFPQITSTASGKRVSVAVRERINLAANEGALVINYSGHGAETGWASENILNVGQVLEWENMDNLPLMVTATCEFGRYDNPKLVSGAEHALLSQKGGVIGLLTTTRPVFSNTNFLLNQAFYRQVFEPVNGEMPRLGNIIKETKNQSINGVVNRNFALLGDPSMRLAYPAEQAVLTKFNGNPIVEGTYDTLRALQEVTFEGEIRLNGAISSDFEGEVFINVFDKKREKETLGDGDENRVMRYTAYESVLFKGSATVRQGRFTFSFRVPKDIDYRLGLGKLNMYAQHATQKRDANGYAGHLKVGRGIVEADPDQQPPNIALFLDDSTFVNGGSVRPNTLLLAFFQDPSGINLTGNGLGHQITAFLDGDTDNPILLNDYYRAMPDDFTQGSLAYPFKGLSPGKHTLTVRAWDAFNNMGETTISFLVTASADIETKGLIAAPNPFREQVELRFNHNFPGGDLRIHLSVFNTSGQKIMESRFSYDSAPTQINGLYWDGKNSSGTRVPSGLYLYRIQVVERNSGAAAQLSGRVLLQE